MTKRILKVLFTFLFGIGSFFAIHNLIIDYQDEKIIFIVLAFVMFVMHIFAWVAPKTFFNFCWKITNIMPDNFDYDTSFSKLELCDIGILISANLLLVISFLFI